MKDINAWNTYNEKDLEQLEELCSGYKTFLNRGKTERECVSEIINQAREHGYIDLDEIISSGRKIKKGDKIYSSYMKKAIALFNIGEEPIEMGMNILGAHIDSPRMDIKQNRSQVQ